MMLAMVTWRSYQESRAFIDNVIGKYDSNRDGVISETELKGMLVDLNDGEDVDDGDVALVLVRADFNKDESISRVEVKCAIATWYAMASNFSQIILQSYDPDPHSCVVLCHFLLPGRGRGRGPRGQLHLRRALI